MITLNDPDVQAYTGRRPARFWISTFAMLAPLVLSAQGDPHMPAQAQAALQRGVAAAKAQDWSTAIAELSRAQKLAPHAPIVLFNLGLAYDRSGQPFPAIGWLRAYVEASTKEGNTTQVLLRIAGLKAELRAQETQVFAQALETALIEPQLQDWARDDAVASVAGEQIRAGEFDGVRPTLLHISVSRRQRDVFFSIEEWGDRVNLQRARLAGLGGDLDLAKRYLDEIHNLSFSVAGIYLYRTTQQGGGRFHSQDGFSRSAAEMVFWERLAGELMDYDMDAPCWAIDFGIGRRALGRRGWAEDEGGFRSRGVSSTGFWLGSGEPGRDYSQKEQRCPPVSALEKWIDFAQTVCRVTTCDLSEAVRRASRSENTEVSRGLAYVAASVGVGLAYYESLDARTSRMR
jgi:tetratricopeptide (TPR) repeat protein